MKYENWITILKFLVNLSDFVVPYSNENIGSSDLEMEPLAEAPNIYIEAFYHEISTFQP